MDQIVVSRYKYVGPVLKKLGYVDEDATVTRYVTPDQVKDKHVFGRVPEGMLSLPKRLSIPVFKVPQECRPETAEELEKYFEKIYVYEIDLIEEIKIEKPE